MQTYNDGVADYEIKDHEVQIGDVTISYDAFTPTALMDFPQQAWGGG